MAGDVGQIFGLLPELKNKKKIKDLFKIGLSRIVKAKNAFSVIYITLFLLKKKQNLRKIKDFVKSRRGIFEC